MYEIWYLDSLMFILWNNSEELACDEAELGPEGFAEKLHSQQELHEQVVIIQDFVKVWNFTVLKSLKWTIL